LAVRTSTVMCCSKEEISSQKIPERRIQEYSYTSPSCTHKAALVKLRTGRTTCVDPEQSWFQQYLKKQKKPRSTSQ
ncbi:CCL18 protein, partial [Gymnorhina tibicen]|nr:CCL18 protein [Gymnorhina tibicen]